MASLFFKINQSDKFIIVDIQIGNTNSITNRKRIKAQQGVLWLTLPIKKNESKLIHSIQIDNNQRLIDLIKQVDGDIYLADDCACQYIDEAAYNSNGIQLTYTSYKPNEYSQLHGNFIPGLSILDVMMNHTKVEIQNMIK